MPHPYTTTVHGLNTLIAHLRSVFPARLTPQTLRTWDIGRSNESSLLATLRYIGVIDEDRTTLPRARTVFGAGSGDEFASGLAGMVEGAYTLLFEEFGDDAWTLSRDALISFIRGVDDTSARVSDQQAVTFQALARQAGRGAGSVRTSHGARRRPQAIDRAVAALGPGTVGWALERDAGDVERPEANGASAGNGGVAITINLPVTDDPAIYQSIFRSIRDHLFDE